MFKQVIVVRSDLHMGKGKIAAQVAHGSMAAVLPNLDDHRVKTWLESSFTKICLSCASEKELFALEDKAADAGLIHCSILDSGRTEFGSNNSTYTVLAIGPDEISVIDEITGDLKLL